MCVRERREREKDKIERHPNFLFTIESNSKFKAVSSPPFDPAFLKSLNNCIVINVYFDHLYNKKSGVNCSIPRSYGKKGPYSFYFMAVTKK